MLASLAAIAVALASEPKKSGLPQLHQPDFAPQLIWLVLTFGVLFFLMAKVALPRVACVIEERRNRIKRDLDEADRLKGETEVALAAYEQSLASARSSANGIAKTLREKLGSEVDAERAKVDGQMSQRIADAEKRIADVKTKAMAEVGQIAADTAEAIVTQLTGKPASKGEVAQAVKAVAGS